MQLLAPSRTVRGAVEDVAASYELRVVRSGPSPPTYRLYADAECLAETVNLAFAARALGSHAELLIAERPLGNSPFLDGSPGAR